VLRIAATAFTLPFLGQSLALLREQYPEVHVALRQRDALETAEALLYDRADIGIGGRGMLGKADIIARPLPSLRFSIAAAQSLAARLSVPPILEELAAFPLLGYAEGSPERQQVDAAFERSGLRPDVALTGDTAFLLSCAETGMGVAVVCGPLRAITQHSPQLAVFDGAELFEDARAWLAVRRGKLLRDFEARLCRSLLPGLDLESFQKDALSRDGKGWEPEFVI
jgi:LysR family cys regulon transcriptional activator